jgi:hypothetical protein
VPDEISAARAAMWWSLIIFSITLALKGIKGQNSRARRRQQFNKGFSLVKIKINTTPFKIIIIW